MTTSPTDALHVDGREALARFILSDHIRGDNSVKQDAFIPPPSGRLSVTRHLNLSSEELWRIGTGVANITGRRLRGRADLIADVFQRKGLRVVPAPIIGNPNHADVLDWPVDKPGQKTLAQEIAAEARFSPTPDMSQ